MPPYEVFLFRSSKSWMKCTIWKWSSPTSTGQKGSKCSQTSSCPKDPILSSWKKRFAIGNNLTFFNLNLKHNISFQSYFLLKLVHFRKTPSSPCLLPENDLVVAAVQTHMPLPQETALQGSNLFFFPFIRFTLVQLFICTSLPLEVLFHFYSLYSNKNLRYDFVI